MYSLLHLDIELLRNNLKSVEYEQNRYMNSLKLQNKKVSDAIARLEIIASAVNDYSMMDSCVRTQSGASSKSESLEVLVEEKSSRQFASGEIRDDDAISNFRVTGEFNDRDEVNSVDDKCLKELSTSRPSLKNKRSKRREITNVGNDDLATGAHHHLLCNKASDENSLHSSPSPVFQKKGCHFSSSLHGADVANKVVETIVLTQYQIGTIIGKQGSTVIKLERMSGARIRTTHLRGDKECKVEIMGRVDQVRKAKEMMEEIMGGTVMARLTYSSILNVRAFIGEKGRQIEELERSTNTRIWFGDSDNSGRHEVKDCRGEIIVKGLKDEVLKAVEIIQRVTGVGKYVLNKI